MGIDFPTTSELIAPKYKKDVEKIQEFLGADSLKYQTIEGLLEAIGLDETDLCSACITGKYKLKNSIDVAELEKNLGNEKITS